MTDVPVLQHPDVVLKLTPFEETVLHVMFLFERAKAQQHGYEGECTFASNFFTKMLGITWQGYHNSAMNHLRELGWITISQPSKRARFYRLTAVGRSALHEHFAAATLYTWYT